MEKRVSMVLLLMAVLVLSDVADGKAKARATLSGIDRKLKLLNKPAVKSIKVFFLAFIFLVKIDDCSNIILRF